MRCLQHRFPYPYLHKFITPEVWKTFNVGINPWNITAVLYSDGGRTRWVSPFSWRSYHINFRVYQMWPDWYSCWFNCRNSITCTHCNVISLEHDWIPWREKSPWNDDDATTFHFLWQLYTIIKIISRRFELDGESENLPKSNQIWTDFVLWGYEGWYGKFQGDIIKNTISSTLSLITVLFEDLFEAINIHKVFCGEKLDPQPSISLLNKTDTYDDYVGGFVFERGIINDDEYNALKKELLMLFEGCCIFGYWEFYKNCFVFCWK